MLKKLKSVISTPAVYSTLVILTYILLSRTLKIYFVEYIPAITNLYAILSRICAAIVVVLCALSFKKLPKAQFISLCAVYALMFLSTIINDGNLRRLFSATYPILALCAFVLLLCRTMEGTKRFVKTMSVFYTVIMGANFILALFAPQLFGRTPSNGVIFLAGLENQLIYSQTIGLLFAKLDDRLNGNKFIFQLYTVIYILTTLINFSAGSVIGAAVLLLYLLFPIVRKFFNEAHYGWQIGLYGAVFSALVFLAKPILNFGPIRYVIVEILHKSTTLTHRTLLWEKALQGIAEKPILGHGLGDTGNLFEIIANGTPVTWSAHNQFLQFIYEYGLLALGAVLVFLFLSVKIIKSYKMTKMTGLFLLFSFTFMILYLVEAPSFNALFFILTLGTAVCRAMADRTTKQFVEEKHKITVVVPVYNIEDFLPECVDSILQQSYQNLEIILVNDGSTDGSLKICEEYAKKDARIKLIDQENGGLSDARNTAIKVATGEYITFVDSDDYIDPDMISLLYTRLIETDADLVSCQFMPVDEESNPLPIDAQYAAFTVTGKKNCMKEFFLDTGIKTCAWGKLHRTELFKDFLYPKDKYHEDVFTTYRIVDLCERITVCPEPLYYYRQRATSIVHHSFSPKHLDSVYACIERAEFVRERYSESKISAFSSIIYSANTCAKRLIGLENVDEEIVSFLQEQYRKYEGYFLLGHSTVNAKLFSVFAFMNLRVLLKSANLLLNFVRKIKK